MTVLIGLPPVDELKQLGKQMRAYALENPCIVAADGGTPGYHRFVGQKYNVAVTLEIFTKPPRWHGSVCVLHETGSPDENMFGLPSEQAILKISEWPPDEIKNANELLGYVLGDTIIDPKQIVQIVPGLYSLHWLTRADLWLASVRQNPEKWQVQ
ncbi:MAG: hypothetical protein ACE5JO_04610 [Candidatus Binatia bacterium]